MSNYKIIAGPAASSLSMIPISTPRGMLNIRGGLVLNQEEYKYALGHGLGKLINAKIAIVISDKKVDAKSATKKAEVKKEAKAVKVEEPVKKEESIKAEEPAKVEQPAKVEEVKVEEALKAEEIKEETVKESSKQESKKSKKK